MTVQLGGIISSNIYRDNDSPKYKRGNRTLIAINVLSIVLFILAKAYYIIKNKYRDRKWNALTLEVCCTSLGPGTFADGVQQQQDYIRNTKLRGSRRLDFRFAH